MKVKITTLMLCVFMSLSILAQHTDGFFMYNDLDRTGRAIDFYHTEDLSFQGMNTVVDAPLDDAVLFLSFLGFVYVFIRRKEVTR